MGGTLLVERLHKILMANCANQNRLASHLALGMCTLSLISNHMYAKSSLKLRDWSNVRLNILCEHKGRFYINMILFCFTLVKINIIGVHAKFSLEWQPLIGGKTLT